MSETHTAPDCAADCVRTLVKVRMQPAMRIETIERTQSQNDIDSGENDVRLGSDSMSAAFLIEFSCWRQRRRQLLAGWPLPAAALRDQTRPAETQSKLTISVSRRADTTFVTLPSK